MSTIRSASWLLLGCIVPNLALADNGDPVAVRFWPQGVVSLETMWNLKITLAAHGAVPVEQLPAADLHVGLTGSAAQLTLAASGSEASATEPPRSFEVAKLDHYLDRLENEAQLRLTAAGDTTFVSSNALHISLWQQRLPLISVDGVRLLILADESATQALGELLEQDEHPLPPIDAILDVGQPASVSDAIVQRLEPSWLVRRSENKTPGNTWAIAHTETQAATEVVQLGDSPWSASPELQQLFERKEAACTASQAVFEKLSVAQMNFKPSNGSHTPRWNAEHMMGRELLFFSQIYAQRAPAIQPTNLNPEQMPPDYQAAHPDWTGAEEARQMQRVSAFSRRFAYLLDGVALDEKAAGSSWTPRGLLQQMERHYHEHTENVIKKFDLPDWPKE